MRESGALLGRVRDVRRRALLLGLTRVALAGATGAGAVLGTGAALLPALAAPWRGGVAAAGFAAALAAAGFLGGYEWRRVRPVRTWREAAVLLSSTAGPSSELVLVGADLAGWGESGAAERGSSPDLVRAHLTGAVRAVEDLDWRRSVPLGSLKPWALRSAAVYLVCGAWFLGNADRVAQAWRTLPRIAPVTPVTVGNLRVRYQPPAYTGLGESVLEGSSGAVEALKGTRVTLEGELSAPATGGRWTSSDGRQAPLAFAGQTFRTSWILEGAGTYALSFERQGRALPSDFQPKPVTVLEDTAPTVELKEPEGDLEVRSDAEVAVRFSASDDFRVDRAELVLQGSAEVRVPLRLAPGRFVEGTGRFLPLAHPGLAEGAHLRVDVWDSDTVSGPKVASSRSVYVTFVDRKKLLEELAGLEERLLEAMIAHLGDHLETDLGHAADADRLRAKARDLTKLLAALVARLRDSAQAGGPIATSAVLRIDEGLRGALGRFLAGERERGGVVPELERDILFLDALLRNLRMEETLGLGEELAALQRGIFDELQAGGATRDLLARIDRMQKLLAEMTAKLARGTSELPDAFANADAVREGPGGEVEQSLAKLRRALEARDREAARRIAEELLTSLDRWRKALERAAEGAGRSQADPLLSELEGVEGEARGLAEEQERILRETRAKAENASRRSADLLRSELRSLQARVEQRLNRIAELGRRIEALPTQEAGASGRPLPPPPPPDREAPSPELELFQASRRLETNLGEVRQGLRQDLGRARAGAAALPEAFEGLTAEARKRLEPAGLNAQAADRFDGAARREIEELRRELESFERRRLGALDSAERQALRRLGAEEGALGERTEELARHLEQLGRKSPLADRELSERARSARSAMEGAEEELGEPDPFGAVAPETEALEGLSEIAKRIGDARRQLQQAGPGGFRLLPQPGRSDGNGRNVDRGAVEIPKESEAKELKAFREEVLRAMRRRGYPREYEGEVERYYERLIR